MFLPLKSLRLEITVARVFLDTNWMSIGAGVGREGFEEDPLADNLGSRCIAEMSVGARFRLRFKFSKLIVEVSRSVN